MRVAKWGGGGGGGGINHVSSKIKWTFHISRTINSLFHVSKEKETFLYHQFFLLWLKTTAKELPCSMSRQHSPASCSWCCEKETKFFV